MKEWKDSVVAYRADHFSWTSEQAINRMEELNLQLADAVPPLNKAFSENQVWNNENLTFLYENLSKLALLLSYIVNIGRIIIFLPAHENEPNHK